MNDRIGFILKVLILSTVLSVLIKYGGRLVSIAPTSLNAAIAVFLPTVILTLLLIWRSRSSSMAIDKNN